MSPALEPIAYSPDPALTAQQHQVLALLADGRSLTECASAAGVHRNTIRNWRRAAPAFAREAEFAVREQAAAWHDHAVALAPKAAEILHEILHSPDTKPALKLRAALAVLKEAATPHPVTPSTDLTTDAELNALHGQVLASPQPVVRNKNQQSCTIVHNAQPIRRAPEPGRNSPCPCGSGQKWKRCCANAPVPQVC